MRGFDWMKEDFPALVTNHRSRCIRLKLKYFGAKKIQAVSHISSLCGV